MDLICGCIYKPKRLLFYIVPTEEEKNAFYDGIVPESLISYNGAFGTYDCPGLFTIKREDTLLEVIGIEYRPDDERIEYPKGLNLCEMEGAFMISSIITDVDTFDKEVVDKCVKKITTNKNLHAIHSYYIRPLRNPDVISVFTYNDRKRILVKASSVTKEKFFNEPILTTELEKQLYYDVYHDKLTGHHNWSYIWPRVSGYGLLGIQDFAFVHFDVKEFKALNIVYGHEVGNDVLCKIVNHLKDKDWIYYGARCDNDKFALMIKDMPQEETQKTLLDFFEEISTFDFDPSYHIYYRCGVVPMKNTILLGDRVADAGKHAQRLGTKFYETEVIFYNDSLQDTENWSVKTKKYLDTAIKKDEFLIYLQPKYDIQTNKLHGAEALIRWKYRGKELLSPSRFIPIFETGGLISKLDDIVLNKVCQNLKRWKEEGIALYPISVNLSRKSFVRLDLVDHLTGIVDSYGVDHNLIDFELTESAAYDDQANMIRVLGELKKRGFKISMDDFGTGYSSLSLLSILPLDTIKIDKSFVDEIGEGKDDWKESSILRYIIAMGKDLGLICLAEGAEDKSQVDKLRELGLEMVQGYYYDKPLPVEEYEMRLK